MSLKVFTDKLQQEKKEMGDYGFSIEPVDVNGGYVAIDKYAEDNLRKSQESITWKTQLEPTYPWKEMNRK